MTETRKVALVTGGRRGIGLGVAKCLAADGCDVAVCGTSDQNDPTSRRVVDELRAFGAEAIYVKADIGEAAERARLVEAVRARFGRLNVLVNNAGVAPRTRDDILEAGEDSFERLIRINLQGPYFLTQMAANWMIEQRREDSSFVGAVVFVTSISAAVASVNRGDYCVSKAGLSMASRLFAIRLAEAEIPVFEVRPGIIATDMTAGVKERYDRLLAEGLAPQRRWGTPEDVGRAVAALVRGDLAYSTGQVVMVDGGMTIQTL
jgi:3-oxoacyl-[acyl-carrier protein] reductase